MATGIRASARPPPVEIDLTGLDSDNDSDDEVVIIGEHRAPRENINPRLSVPNLPNRPRPRIDEALEDVVFQRLVRAAPPPPPRERLFSPEPRIQLPPLRGNPPPPMNTGPPRIGLGGGLMAIRDRAGPSRFHSQDNARRLLTPVPQVRPPPPPPPPAPRRGGMGFGWLDLIWPPAGANPEMVEPPVIRYHPEGVRVEMRWGPGPGDDLHIWGDFPHGVNLARGPGDLVPPAVVPPPEEEFNSKWIHRNPVPLPGFSWDFEVAPASAADPIDVDSEEPIDVDALQSTKGKGKAKAEPVVEPEPVKPMFVCARCDKPLVMGPKSVYSLRCGHVVCAGCEQGLVDPSSGNGVLVQVGDEPITDNLLSSPSKPHPEPEPEPPTPGPSRTLRSSARHGAKAPYVYGPASKQARAPQGRSKGKPSLKTLMRKAGQVSQEYMWACPVDKCHKQFTWQRKSVINSSKDGLDWTWQPKSSDDSPVAIFT